MSLNENLRIAKRQKNDEFYTQLSDIENELRHYTGHLQRQASAAARSRSLALSAACRVRPRRAPDQNVRPGT